VYKKFKLKNGLKVVTHPMPGMQSVALGIWIKVGGRYESTRIKGISHFIEHMLFKGSKSFSCSKIKESIEGVGGALNGFTSEEATCYLVKIPHQHMELALNILSDMVKNPLFSPIDLEKERTVILEEIKMYKDLPHSYVHELLDGLLWPEQPLGESILGTADSVCGLKREDLIDFKAKNYIPKNIVISAAGLLDHRKLFRMIEDIFPSCSPAAPGGFEQAKENQRAPQMKLFNKDTEQTHLALGFRAFERAHPLRHALALLNIITGGNMSSRLFNEVREKRGLAYEIGSQLKRFQDTGSFVVHAGIDNKKVIDAVKVILFELKKIKDGPVTKDEFRRAKDFYLGQLSLALEDTLDNMFWIAESSIFLNKTFTLKEIIREVSGIKLGDIAKAAKLVFNDSSMNLALIGPLKESEADIRGILSIG